LLSQPAREIGGYRSDCGQDGDIVFNLRLEHVPA
jgi:hypothetical protein